MNSSRANGLHAASGRVARESRASRLRRALAFVLATLAAGAIAAVPAHSSLTGSTPERVALRQARVIRAEVNAKYRLLPGRKLIVTEATATGVVKTLTLVT